MLRETISSDSKVSAMGGWSESGLLLAALSSLTFSVCSLLAKSLSSLHPVQLSCLSFLGVVLASGVIAMRRDDCLFPSDCRKALVGRSLAGTLFLVSSFYSVQLMPLGDASVLFYTAPVFTALLAKPLLNESASPYNFLLAFVLIVCVILVVKPSFLIGSSCLTTEYLLGATMAVIASLMDALGNIALRGLRRVNASIVLFNFSLLSFFQTCLISLFFTNWAYLSFKQLILILILVFLTIAEQTFVTLALKSETAAQVALFQASDIVYGYMFQVIFFNKAVDVVSIFGAISIAVITFLISWQARKPKYNYSISVC